jgi:hypothetical protein
MERRSFEAATGPPIDLKGLMARLPEVLAKIRDFIVSASDDDFGLALQALQIEVRATRERVDICGVTPAISRTDNADDLYATRTNIGMTTWT